jgi:hypothetical protein
VSGPILWSGAHSSIDQFIEVIVVREDDVATHVEEEALGGDVCASKATCFRGSLNEDPVLVLVLVHTSGSTKPWKEDEVHEDQEGQVRGQGKMVVSGCDLWVRRQG